MRKTSSVRIANKNTFLRAPNTPKTMAQFNAASTALEFAAAPKEQIHGKKVLITGPSIGGLGFEATISIASQSPALLVLAGRSREKLDAVAAKINEKYPNVETRKVELDLASLSAVRFAAKEVLTYPEELDVVIANAGVMAFPDYRTTQNGFEMQFGPKHLSHFVFVNTIMSKLLQGTGEKRVVNVSSGGHEFGGIRFDDPNFEVGPAHPAF
jgi:NAD(P)-dependent dehydrogenase (short-subunit alcohol dehydrogenase family)